ncbi:RNA polymerase sigma factor [Paenibacillus sp. CF384]|uniref:RNA polymerase sigma factor n=1 Tax=Paenibacillus sp. CF384 TaxID=1884382 RepID=UPI0008952C56|nr:sigma-70 family RNA polymerase sigma factor [Paenibacillus sp. CF384]SDX28117.1 RNA polymerase sigma factor, sigma-70 family [Paenibacillus sp. CF384]
MIVQIQNGDREAYAELVAKYRDELYRLIWSVVRDRRDAEDTLQETFVRIYLSLPDYRGDGFKAWASRTAVNLAIDCRRRNTRKEALLQRAGQEAISQGEVAAGSRPKGNASSAQHGAGVMVEAAAGHAPPAEIEAMKRDRRRRVRAMVSTLPEGYRRVVRSYFLEDRPYKEIAENEQLQVKSVESKLYRARQWMRKHWKEEDLE